MTDWQSGTWRRNIEQSSGEFAVAMEMEERVNWRRAAKASQGMRMVQNAVNVSNTILGHNTRYTASAVNNREGNFVTRGKHQKGEVFSLV